MVRRWPQIGIVQGRLLPPVKGNIQAFPKDQWEEEFSLAREVGFDGIEWIFDGEENPLLNSSGRRSVRKLIRGSGVEIPSVSADYLMFNPIFGVTKKKSVAVLKKLISACGELGISRINVPLEDQSELKNLCDVTDAIFGLRECLPFAKRRSIVLAIECSLAPHNLLTLMKNINHPWFKINYDLGNSVALGYDTDVALRLLAPYLGGIHIKDRTRLYGSTVPLGTGDTDFKVHFRTLREIGYRGWYIIQGARGEDETKTARTYLSFVRNLLGIPLNTNR